VQVCGSLKITNQTVTSCPRVSPLMGSVKDAPRERDRGIGPSCGPGRPGGRSLRGRPPVRRGAGRRLGRWGVQARKASLATSACRFPNLL